MILIPVLAKADALNPEEMSELKLEILYRIQEANIKVCEFPEIDHENKKLKALVPFEVVGANTTLVLNGKKTRGRKYPWGAVDIAL